MIDLNFQLTFRGLLYSKPILSDWSFDTHSLLFTFFVGGQAVNKITKNQYWRMEDKERRNKLG